MTPSHFDGWKQVKAQSRTSSLVLIKSNFRSASNNRDIRLGKNMIFNLAKKTSQSYIAASRRDDS